MRTILALVTTLCLVSPSTYADTAVDTEKFIKSIEGGYDILKAGGVAPHADNALADVYADTTEAAFTLPYCPATGGQCDPGYLFLEYAKTTVTQATASDGTVTSTLVYVDGAGRKAYTWTDKNGTVTFHNPQYKGSGPVTVLEHVLTKASAKP